ncbi:hypothetical protein [Streptomyces yunnanensis]|uniref:Uncharacterized protein n=1 Tax=Streptomyces yunnanensis TaxID=156453 RepID=A0A9X8QZ87_9ACTN|nr:hypothetical protein [Streptomyces yunnanensis]SHN20981.1 hypothetical protein SAMN05216268_1242 [Streptomyces yunnanensis]
MVLGNHDCSGLIPGSGGAPSRGDREVLYATLLPHVRPVPAASAARLTVDVYTVDVATRRVTLAHQTHSTGPVAPAAWAAAHT